MRCIKCLSVVSSGTQFALKRHLQTDLRPTQSSAPKSKTTQPASGRFAPARADVKVIIRNPTQPHRTAPTDQAPDGKKRQPQPGMYTEAETSHIDDVSPEPVTNYWRFAFPRGVCPKQPWWDRQKPAGTKLSDLRWTSGRMYRHFWERSGIALAFSGYFSFLLGGAGVVSLISHSDGVVPAGTRLCVFTALALPSFAYGIYRSKTLQEGWKGLMGGMTGRKGASMMPYIHVDSKWSYNWWFRPINVKAGDVVAFRSARSSVDTRDVSWLGKRVIAVELDVVKMEKLGFPDGTYFQVPKGHVFVRGDNIENSLDSRQFGPVPFQSLRGRITASSTKLNPRWWLDWEKIPEMETAAFTVTDPLEWEATRHKWEGKAWDNVPRRMKSALGESVYQVKRYRLKIHRSRKK